jgi:hypothetical protein
MPSTDIGFEGSNRRSAIADHLPPGTILFAEAHDVGPALTAVIDRFRDLPELADGFGEFDSAVGLLGGFDSIVGWWGDVAVVVAEDAAGEVGGGLVIVPRDAGEARDLLATVRSYIALVGAGIGVTVRDEDHDGTTITIIDIGGAIEASGEEVPAGTSTELALVATDELVVIGYGSSFVTAVLDAGPGASLADDARYRSLLDRIGADNLGTTFVDLTAIREFVEPLIEESASAAEWALYTTDIRPYLEPFDALIQGVRKDGELDRAPSIITVR